MNVNMKTFIVWALLGAAGMPNLQGQSEPNPPAPPAAEAPPVEAPAPTPAPEVTPEVTPIPADVLAPNPAPAPSPPPPAPVVAKQPIPSQEVLYHSEFGLGGFHAYGDINSKGGVFTGSFGRYTKTRFFRIDLRFDNYLTDVRFRAQKAFLGYGRYYQFTDNIFRKDDLESLAIRASLGKGLGIIWTAEDRGMPNYVRQRTFETEIGIYFQVQDLFDESSRKGIVKIGNNLDFYLKNLYLETKADFFIDVADVHNSRFEFDHSISFRLSTNGRWRVKSAVIGEYLLGNRPTGRALYYRAQVSLVYQFRRQKTVASKALELLDSD